MQEEHARAAAAAAEGESAVGEPAPRRLTVDTASSSLLTPMSGTPRSARSPYGGRSDRGEVYVYPTTPTGEAASFKGIDLEAMGADAAAGVDKILGGNVEVDQDQNGSASVRPLA